MCWGGRGEHNHHAKLTEEEVLAIKEALERREPVPQVALRFGVSRSTVYAIRRGRRWGHVRLYQPRNKETHE